MVAKAVHQCECESCQRGDDERQKGHHQQMNLLMSRLDEQQRRWYAAVESGQIGYGGDRQVSRVRGLNEETIRRGRRELAGQLLDRPAEKVRVGGGGRPRVEKKTPR